MHTPIKNKWTAMLKLIANNKLCAYDPLVADAYLLRVAAISNKCGVSAAEAVYSAQNILLVAQGALIAPDVAAVVYANKLNKPLEDCLQFEALIDSVRLEEHFLTVMRQDDLLSALNEHQDIASTLKNYIAIYDKFPLLKQKITVMALSMPELFLRTVYCSWFALLIAKEMRFSEQGCTDVFLAALSHDIGMLHVSAVVLEKKEDLVPDDWRHIQEHVLIGALLLKQMPLMPADVVEAVYEHHERCDGTGYPKGKVESELSYAGKIVGLADSIIAIYHNRFKHQQLTWRDVIPVIQMNAQAYFHRHDEILAAIWRRSEMPFKNVVQGDGLAEFMEDLLRERTHLLAWVEIFRESLLSLGFTHGDRQLHALQTAMLHLFTSVKGSGVLNPELCEWLRNIDVASDKDAYRKIEKAHVQQQEIIFHLQRLERMMQLYVGAGNGKVAEFNLVLRDALERVKRLTH
jgi:HD-GYP domain-containing protein (c-di-GMP phosphodiesterase class II)